MITIITPVLNAEKHIGDMIDNVQRQGAVSGTHMIVENGSTDRTVEIIKNKTREWQGLSGIKIMLVYAKYPGIYEKFNTGIALNGNPWLIFMGADDRFLEADTLEKASIFLTVFEKRGVHVVYGNVLSTRFGKVYDGKFYPTKLLSRNICHQAMFYHRKVFWTAGKYKSRYRRVGDYELNLRLMLSGRYKFQYIPLVISEYADGGTSSQGKDFEFERDYGKICFTAIMSGRLPWVQKFYLVCRVFWKVMRRRYTERWQEFKRKRQSPLDPGSAKRPFY